MFDGSGMKAVILDGNLDQLWIESQDTLYTLETKNIEYIKVKGYNETQTLVYTASGALSLAVGSVGLITLDPSSFAFLGIGALCTIGAVSSSKKYRFKPSQMVDIGRIKLHFQYPQGLTEEQHSQILLYHRQSDYLPVDHTVGAN
ncbi:MAG: hypothetical protein IPL46_22520 [Saprospiraceae bacterium]|nr:hypothetical protein [Saprospiraceae bacterium]